MTVEARQIGLPLERPANLEGLTVRVPLVHSGGLYEKIYITINFYRGRPFEVFSTVGKTGSDAEANAEGVCRMISAWLRAGGDIETVVKQLRGIKGESTEWDGAGNQSFSIPDAIARQLKRVLDGELGPTMGSEAAR